MHENRHPTIQNPGYLACWEGSCNLLIYLGVQINAGEFAFTRLEEELMEARLRSTKAGILAIVCAIIPLCVRRGKWQPSALDTNPADLIARGSKALSEHVKDLKHGPYRAVD
jgi:hypothetical protein